MSIYSYNSEFTQSGLDELIWLSDNSQFEKSYLLESERGNILNMLSEKTHLLEYDNVDFQENISQIVTTILKNKYAINHFSNEDLYAIEWIESLDIEIHQRDDISRIYGTALITKSIFDFTEKIIKYGAIHLEVPKNAGIPAFRSAVLHELKHLFTTLLEKRYIEKDIELRNNFVTNKLKIYNQFKQLDSKEWRLKELREYEYEYVQNTLLEFCYYVNENEIRSKLENVGVLFRRRLEGLKTSVYMKFYFAKQENKCIEQLYLNIDVIATYKKAKQFCKAIQENEDFLAYLNKSILNEVNRAYDKKWQDSSEWLKYLEDRFKTFAKKSADVICMVVNETNANIAKYLKTIKRLFYNTQTHTYDRVIMYQNKVVDYKTLVFNKLSPFTYIEDLLKYCTIV